MATASAQAWRELGTKRPGDEGYRPDLDANFSNDFMEYASPERSGISGGFYTIDRGLPWHVRLSQRLGTRELMDGVETLQTTEQALIRSGSFVVEKAPAADSETGIIVPGMFVTRRADTKAPLGIVGQSYKVFQERELAELADFIVDQGGHIRPMYETGGHMRDGAFFFLSIELGGLDILIPGDPSPLQTYLLLTTTHDGTKSAGYFVTQVRTVCKNTADLAQQGALRTYKIRHTGSLDGKVIEARKALGIALKSTETVKQLTERLALASVVDAQVKAIFEATWPTKVSEDSDEEVERKNRNVERALALYEASPNLDGIRGTAWGAYNAVTEYLDHEVAYHGRKGSEVTDVRAESLLFGAGHQAKERALRAALAAAK